MTAVRRGSVDLDGRARTYTVAGDAYGKPLILIFHGSRQTGEKHRRFTGRAFDALAQDGSAVVAYLDGYRGNWNDARRESRFPARRDDIDDVGFARAVIEQLAAGHRIDRTRVVAVGYSNGGQMVMRLAHETPELLAGAVVIAATMPAPGSFLDAGRPAAPLPMLLIHGTRDRIVPYEGGTMSWWARKAFKVGGESLSMPATAAYFAARNGIDAAPVSTRLPARGRTWVERTEYRQPGHPSVQLYTVHGGGHTVPGPGSAPAVVGRTNHDVNTAELVRTFFLDSAREGQASSIQ
ncbi:alpha/beta hydrolase family esterase [Actinoplanes sp. URMC 104]|uniref:alpha/beta hydrolase family esterase n=1 Tax=Actinoplanes sp. URMC 104 TaxID=3423409 RepID=UPI003F1AE74F